MTEPQKREILFAHVVGEPNDSIAVSTKGLYAVSDLKAAFEVVAKSRIRKLSDFDFDIYCVNIPDDGELEKEANKQLQELKANGQRLLASEPLSSYPHLLGMIGRVGVVSLLVELIATTPTVFNPTLSAVHSATLSAEGLSENNQRPYRVSHSAPPWLIALHNVLWNKPHLKKDLFRNATGTFSQFLQLEERLNARNPARTRLGDENYEARDVREIKLGFPHNLPTLDAPHEDSLVYDSFDTHFPVMVSYCDLSALNIGFLPRGCSSPIMIRDEYLYFSDLLRSTAKDYEGDERCSSCVISGQTGIGKKTYLYLLLIERLLEGKRTYFQSRTGSVFRIGDSIERLHPSSAIKGEDGTAIALLDGPGDEPADVLLTSARIQVIATSPPMRKWKWIDQLGCCIGMSYCMKPWSRAEFLVAGIFLYPLDIPYHRLKSSIGYFGHNPLRSFWASTSTTRMDELKSQITSIIERTNFSETDLYAIDEIFERHPRGTRTPRLFVDARIEAVSKWAIELVLKQLRPDELETYPARRYLELARRMNSDSDSREPDV